MTPIKEAELRWLCIGQIAEKKLNGQEITRLDSYLKIMEIKLFHNIWTFMWSVRIAEIF